MPVPVPVDDDALATFCERHHVRRLALFGSVLRDDFSVDSDVDVLIEFEPGHKVGLLEMVRLEDELSDLFGGRRVDLRTPEELSRYFRDEVLATAQTKYARA